jgi:hypothetical protein
MFCTDHFSFSELWFWLSDMLFCPESPFERSYNYRQAFLSAIIIFFIGFSNPNIRMCLKTGIRLLKKQKISGSPGVFGDTRNPGNADLWPS